MPFSASSGFGSEAIVYGASIMLVLDQKFLLPARLPDSRPKKVPAPVSGFAQSFPRLAVRTERYVPLLARPDSSAAFD